MFRTYHNVANGANLQIHTFLESLEKVMEEEHDLPDTLFIQIDGGSENTAKAVLGICELLVAKGIFVCVIMRAVNCLIYVLF